MRKIHWIVVPCMVALMTLGACEQKPSQLELGMDSDGPVVLTAGPAQKNLSSDYGVDVFTDPDTGCEYLTKSTGGITARMEGNKTLIAEYHRGCRH